LFAEDSSLSSPLNLVTLGMQLYKASEENKVDQESHLRPNDSPAVVALRTLLFRAIANRTGKPGAVQMQPLMQWIADPSNDDITVATQLPFKLLLGEDLTGQEHLCKDMQKRVAKAQSNKLEELSPSELEDAVEFEQTREAQFEDKLEGEIQEVLDKMRGLGENTSSLVERGHPDGEHEAASDMQNEVASDMEKKAKRDQRDGARRAFLKKIQGYLRVFTAVAWNVVLTVLSYVIGSLVCFVVPAAGYLWNALFGMLWCFVTQVLGNVIKMGIDTIYKKWSGVPRAVEGFVSQPPNITGDFKKCMSPFQKAATFVGGTWKRNSQCFASALTGASLYTYTLVPTP